MAHFLLLGAAGLLHAFLMGLQSQWDEEESNYLQASQEACWASDRCVEAQFAGADDKTLQTLKEDEDKWEKEKEKYY